MSVYKLKDRWAYSIADLAKGKNNHGKNRRRVVSGFVSKQHARELSKRRLTRAARWDRSRKSADNTSQRTTHEQADNRRRERD